MENGCLEQKASNSLMERSKCLIDTSAKDPQRLLEFTFNFRGRGPTGRFQKERRALEDSASVSHHNHSCEEDKSSAPTRALPIWISRHPWAEIAGVFHGKPAGARIKEWLPSNPGYPNNGWLMRHGFGFSSNISYPGLKPIMFEPAAR